MDNLRVNISKLKSEGKETIGNLVKFLEEKVDLFQEKDFIIIKRDDNSVSKKYVRLLLRKFLYKNNLKPFFRVISSEDSFNIIKIKIEEYEEE
jgi:hypothetical protein